MNRSMIFWATAGLLLVVAALLWFVMVKPEITRLGAAAQAATEEADHAKDARSQGAGPAYEKGIQQFKELRADAVQSIDIARSRHAMTLQDWFPEMTIAAGASGPTPEEFQRAYAFQADRFVNDLREQLRKAGGATAESLKLIRPPFAGGGTPPSEADIAKWQRIANIEKRLLLVAAKNGAAPTQEVHLDPESAPADDPDPAYERQRIELGFAVSSGRLSRLLHGLIGAFDDAGGICRLRGFSLKPHGEDVIKTAGDDPPVLVAVTLTLGFPTPTAGATPP